MKRLQYKLFIYFDNDDYEKGRLHWFETSFYTDRYPTENSLMDPNDFEGTEYIILEGYSYFKQSNKFNN